MECKIYILRNSVNDKVYVGQTWLTFEERWHGGIGYAACTKLARAIKKYGQENFYYELLATCTSQNDADRLECFYIEKYDSIKNGYNIKEGGYKGRHSAETIAKMSLAKMGNTNCLGKILSVETKKKISDSLKGKPKSDEHRKALSKAHLGNSLSEEARHKISEKMKGVPKSDEAKKKMSEAAKKRKRKKGYHRSAETKRKISEKMKEYHRRRKCL